MEYLKILWCWLIVASPMILLYSWLQWPSTKATLCFSIQQIPTEVAQAPIEAEQGSLAKYAISVLPEVFILFFECSIAVAWHRLILRNERVAVRQYLRFDKVVWNYFTLGLILLFLGELPNLLEQTGGWSIDGGQNILTMLVTSLVALVILIFTLPYTIRLPVLLPARALELNDITIKEVMDKTRCNFWRLSWGQFFCALPFFPLTTVMFFLIYSMGCANSGMGAVIYIIVNQLILLILFPPVYLSFLSLSYRHFFESKTPDAMARPSPSYNNLV
jgi:hypothetical protein